jgi:membrane-associated phospholipid phosphatase
VIARGWLLAPVAFLIFALLGFAVAGRPPGGIDLAAAALRGEGTPLAMLFTALGRWYVLAPLAAVAAFATIAWHGDVRAILVLMGVQLLSQGAVAIVKDWLHRPRPAYWIAIREHDYSFPSGHATTAIVFFGMLLVLVLRTATVPRPLVVPLAILLGVCVIGIPWSRLALGAHYASDVLGGLVFGCGWLVIALAAAQRLTSARITP